MVKVDRIVGTSYYIVYCSPLSWQHQQYTPLLQETPVWPESTPHLCSVHLGINISYNSESVTMILWCFSLTRVEYVLMGGQLFAPHTNAKWILGSGSFRDIFNLWHQQKMSSAFLLNYVFCLNSDWVTDYLGSSLENGRLMAPTGFLLALRIPLSMSLRLKTRPPMI